jgi:hypothetical protein
MQSVRDAAGAALRDLLKGQPTTAAKVGFAWQVAAGAALGRASATEWLPDGTLRVSARDAAWRREIQRARPVIAERLRQLLGEGVVRAIVVRDGSAAGRARRRSP